MVSKSLSSSQGLTLLTCCCWSRLTTVGSFFVHNIKRTVWQVQVNRMRGIFDWAPLSGRRSKRSTSAERKLIRMGRNNCGTIKALTWHELEAAATLSTLKRPRPRGLYGQMRHWMSCLATKIKGVHTGEHHSRWCKPGGSSSLLWCCLPDSRTSALHKWT